MFLWCTVIQLSFLRKVECSKTGVLQPHSLCFCLKMDKLVGPLYLFFYYCFVFNNPISNELFLILSCRIFLCSVPLNVSSDNFYNLISKINIKFKIKIKCRYQELKTGLIHNFLHLKMPVPSQEIWKCEVSLAAKPGSTHHYFLKMSCTKSGKL